MSITEGESKAALHLTLEPTEMVLTRDSNGNKGIFFIRNNLSSPLVFKITSTNPDAFEVHPRHGVLAVEGRTGIQVTLLQGNKCDSNEKFLVLTVVTDKNNLTSEQIYEIFKHTSKTVSHSLPCSIEFDDANGGNGDRERTTAARLEIMERSIKASMMIQVIILLLVCFLIALFCNTPKENYTSLFSLLSRKH